MTDMSPTRLAQGARQPVPERLVVVGSGMAGLKLVEELHAAAPGRFAVTMVGAEPEAAYNRVLLSSMLAGEASAADIALRDAAWYAAANTTLVTGVAVCGIDPEARTVRLADGRADGSQLVFARRLRCRWHIRPCGGPRASRRRAGFEGVVRGACRRGQAGQWVAWFRWQADQWPGAMASSAGTSSRQRAMAWGQRG